MGWRLGYPQLAQTIPPIIARGILIDIAGFKGLDALPSQYIITPEDLQGASENKKQICDLVTLCLFEQGTLRYWNDVGANQEKIGEHDSAGIQLPAAKWLVEEKGAIMIGSDTSGLEQWLHHQKIVTVLCLG